MGFVTFLTHSCVARENIPKIVKRPLEVLNEWKLHADYEYHNERWIRFDLIKLDRFEKYPPMFGQMAQITKQ